MKLLKKETIFIPINIWRILIKNNPKISLNIALIFLNEML